MTLLPKTRKANSQLRNLCFAIASFIIVVLISGFLIGNVEARQPREIDIVYTQTNIPTENGNTIVGFGRDASGTLTQLPTSPFPTQGAGIPNAPIIGGGTFSVTALASDQEVIVNPEHTRLFAVNSGSSTIAVFDIRKDGSLSPVEGSPFPSGGVQPVSLGLAGDILCVVNQNLEPQNPAQEASDSLPNYTTFRVTPRGRLIPIKNATASVPKGSLPTQALISANKRLLFGTDGGTGLLRSYQILRDGRLRQSPNSPKPIPASAFPPNPIGLTLGLQVHPQQPILYVAFTLSNELGVYSYDQDGNLTFLKAIPNSGIFICWIAINKAGTRLYTTNPGDDTVSVYNIEDPTTPVEIQTVRLNEGTNQGFVGDGQLVLNPTESFLHVISQPFTTQANGLHVLSVNPKDGTLSEVSSSPTQLPSVDNSFPQGIAAI